MTIERALREAGISVVVREYPLMYKETEVFVDTSKHDEEVRAKFAERLMKSDYANGYFDTENGYVSVDKVLAEYEKENR